MSETDFLKLKKHDNVETNTEKFDIENYLNGNWDKINENAKKTNKQILELETEKAELEKELKEAQEDFYQNSIRGQASGEYIHVEDSSNCRAKIGIGGNQEQETRSGKNLLELMEGTYSNNGITAVVKNGIVTLNGTAKAISFVGINLLKSIELTNDKAYHLSAFNEKTVGDGTNYCSLRINQDNIQVLFNTVNVNGSITTNLKISYITIRTAQGITYNNFVIKPQLELGNGTDTWEQGGASPSSNYQSPIKTVGSNINLFDLENYYNAVGTNACTKRLLDNGISINFTDGSDAYIGDVYNTGTTMTENKRPACIKVKPNTTYTLKMSSAPKCYMSFFDKNYKSVKDYVQITSSNYIFTTNSSTCYIYLRLGYQNRTSGLTSYDFTDIKCVEGTEVGEYSKYNQGSTKIVKCNTNLYDGKNEVGGINNDGSLSSTTDRWRTINYINVKNLKNLIIRVYDIETSGALGRYCLYDDKYNFLSSVQILNTQTDLKVDNASYLKFWFLNEKVASSAQVQVEEGNTAKKYNQHEEQSYIMPVQSEMLEGDYFDFDNEEEVHIFGKKALTGNENWSRGTTRKGFYYFDYSDNNFVGSYNAKSDIFCNIAEKISASDLYEITSQKYLIAVYTKTLRLSLNNISTVDELKSYLKAQYDAGIPVVVYYKLATSKRLKFTNEQKAVAKELSNARTYKNVTNITTDSKAVLSLDYAKDLETLLTSKESEV